MLDHVSEVSNLNCSNTLTFKQANPFAADRNGQFQSHQENLTMQCAPMRLAVGSLRPSSGNPRRVFEATAMAQLVASVKEKGVIQPILARVFDEHTYEIIAGERRFRAALEAHGKDYEIDALVYTEITDSEALELAIIENSARTDISESEEAEAAAKLLGNCAGDRDEAAKRLGWSRSKFDKRVALMACSEAVRTALAEGQIKIGHAELLATLSEQRQVKALAQVVESGVSVEDFKAAIGKYALKLAEAIFDKQGCVACPHNSSLQRTLFATALEDGCCTNAPCFEEKTEAKIESIREALVSDHGNVRVIRPGEQFISLKLVADGPKGVGSEQAGACRSCKDFGATVSAQPGTLGNVETGRCMNVACNSKFVAAKLRAEQKAAAPAAPAKPAATAKAAATGKTADAKTKSLPAKQAAPVQLTAASLRTPVKDYRDKVLRNALARFINRDFQTSLTLLAALFAARAVPSLNKGSAALTGAAQKYLPAEERNLVATLDAAKASSNADCVAKVVQRIAPAACLDIELRQVEQLLAYHNVNLSEFWKIDQHFLVLLTKAELESVAESTGIKAAMGADAYKKALGGKKDEMIAAFLAVKEFDYAIVPSFLAYNDNKMETE